MTAKFALLLLSSGLLVFGICIAEAMTTSKMDFKDPNCDNKQVIVQLFEWSWDAVANECEQVLGPKGFCGVQVSPPQEHILGDAWWTRYQPVSYKLNSRSGTREQFKSMVKRCNAAGVNVIADVVINHMSGHSSSGNGIGGSGFDGNSQNYYEVPYTYQDFHQPYCEIHNNQDASEVRNCYMEGLNDLDASKDYVREKIVEYLNDLLSIGVKGFRLDAARNMWPKDLKNILSRVDGSPFVINEVIDNGGEVIHTSEYYDLGKVTEFKVCSLVECIKNGDFGCLNGYSNGLTENFHALVFVDNHDNQRTGGALTYKDDSVYKMAVGFVLAHSYGFKRVMSSYAFTDIDQGPPVNQPESVNSSLSCGNGWVCEHRWSSIMNMVQFANKVAFTNVGNWQIKEDSLGFSRGTLGFFAMGDLNNVRFYTGMPNGEYCDIIHDCQRKIKVYNGLAVFNKTQPNDPVVAICVGCT